MEQGPPLNRVFTNNTSCFNSFNLSTNHNNTFNVNTAIDDEKRQILEWLSPLDPRDRHHGVSSDRLEGIGNWLLEASEFREWRDGEYGSSKAVLFCCGNPGVGKTYLSSLAIDSLCDKDCGEGIIVAGLYCDFLAQQEQSPTNMLGAVLKQLVSGREIPDHIVQSFRKAKKELGGRCLGLPNLVKLLKTTVVLLSNVFICIDALDELLPRHRQELLGGLRDIVQESPGARILLTARPHIHDEIMKFFTEAVTIPISPTKHDIKTYLEMRLDRDTEPNAMDDDLRADILRIIPESTSEIFLLVSLNMDAILEEMTICQRRRKLLERTKGNGLGDAYSATLARVKAQKGSRARLGMEALLWISHAERPLKPSELCYALGVEMGSTDLDVQNVPAIKTLLSCSLGLVTVEASSSTVRLIHLTLQEYLCHNPTLFHSPHLTMAEVCPTYLNLECVRSLPLAPHLTPETTPFVQYASCYWGTNLTGEISKSVKVLALRLLGICDKHVSSQLLLSHELGWRYYWWNGGGILESFTGLRCAAYFGLGGLAIDLLETKEWDLNATDAQGGTAITWAARKGHENVVKLLLEQSHVNPDTADKQGRTPLSWAAESGHATIAMMLLECNNVNPNTVDQGGQTPLWFAALYRHEEVMQMLLERKDVNPNIQDVEGQSPLAERGYARAVNMLLERSDVNPNTANQRGRTPLLLAAMCGHEGVVNMLLERSDIDPDTADGEGQTPLSWAAERGHIRVVKILLKRNDVSPNTVNLCGRIPLFQPAMYGYKGIVETLLERNNVNPDMVDGQGQTPLSWAAKRGHTGVVRIFLKRNDVNPNVVGQRGRTPLLQAAICGYEGAVKALLERNDVNPNTADKAGQTPLLQAAMYGYGAVVKILLERNNINPNTADGEGRTPLSIATERGYADVVMMFLERSNVNPGMADKEGRTPLLLAAARGHAGVATMLLKRNDVNTNTVDKSGQTPLLQAAMYGYEGVVKALLERNDLNPDTANKDGQTPLLWAVEGGHVGVVKMLLDRNYVYPNTADSHSRTPLLLAAMYGYEAVVKALLERNSINPNAADGEGM